MQRRPETLRVSDKMIDDLALGHESVGVASAIVGARQPDRPVGNDKAEAVPAATPCFPDVAPLQNDVVNTYANELVAKRKPRLSCADDDDVDPRLHRRAF